VCRISNTGAGMKRKSQLQLVLLEGGNQKTRCQIRGFVCTWCYQLSYVAMSTVFFEWSMFCKCLTLFYVCFELYDFQKPVSSWKNGNSIFSTCNIFWNLQRRKLFWVKMNVVLNPLFKKKKNSYIGVQNCTCGCIKRNCSYMEIILDTGWSLCVCFCNSCGSRIWFCCCLRVVASGLSVHHTSFFCD